MVKKYCNSSVFISVLICIILYYSGLIKLEDRNKYFSLIPQEQIEQIFGQLRTSPVKTSDGRYYYSRMRVISVMSGSGKKSSAVGDITVYIPGAEAEALLPGKLYSRSKSRTANASLLWEAGGNYCVTGRFSDNQTFYISSCIKSAFPDTIYGKLDYFRALARLQFKRLMFSWGAAGGLLLALLCGAKEYTSSEIALSFRNAGLSHILALSGMHLSMFSGIAMFFGKKIKRKKLSFIIRVCTLIIFVWFAGFSPSLLRAFICSMLMIIAALANVDKPDMLLILCFSFLCQTIISPGDIYSSGFILSYSALAGILLTNRFFLKFYVKFLPGYIAASLGSSTGAQTFTAPISLYLFKSFSPIGIIATTIVSPVITIFIYSGLLLIILCLIIPVLNTPSAFFMNVQYNIIKFLVNFFSKAFIWRIG